MENMNYELEENNNMDQCHRISNEETNKPTVCVNSSSEQPQQQHNDFVDEWLEETNENNHEQIDKERRRKMIREKEKQMNREYARKIDEMKMIIKQKQEISKQQRRL